MNTYSYVFIQQELMNNLKQVPTRMQTCLQKLQAAFECVYCRGGLCCTYGSWPRRCRPCSRGLRHTSTSCGCTPRRGTASRWPSTWPEASGDGRNGRVTHPTDPAGAQRRMRVTDDGDAPGRRKWPRHQPRRKWFAPIGRSFNLCLCSYSKIHLKTVVIEKYTKKKVLLYSDFF